MVEGATKGGWGRRAEWRTIVHPRTFVSCATTSRHSSPSSQTIPLSQRRPPWTLSPRPSPPRPSLDGPRRAHCTGSYPPRGDDLGCRILLPGRTCHAAYCWRRSPPSSSVCRSGGLARQCDRCRRRCRRPQPSPSPGNGARPPPTSGLPGERNAALLFKSPGGRGGAAGDRGPPIVLGEMDVVFPPRARQQRRHPRDPPHCDPIFCPRAGRESRPAGGGSGASFAAVVVVVVELLEAAAAEASPSLEGAAAATTAEDRVPFHDTRHQVVSPPKERPAATTAFFKGGAEWST